MKARHMLMAAGLVAAGALVLFGDKTPAASDVAEAVERRPQSAATATAMSNATANTTANSVATPAAAPVSAAPAANSGKAPAAEVQILRLLPRSELLGEAGEGSFGGAGAVFGSQNWMPPAPPPQAPPPPPPPQAPPLPFTYIGKAASDGAWEVFLARGEKTYVVRAQMVLDGVYRVDAVAPPMLKLTYLPLNQSQQLNIGVPD